jgi:hypothetical protein
LRLTINNSRPTAALLLALGISTFIACCLATCSPANRKNVKMQKITSINGTSSILGSSLMLPEFIFMTWELGVGGKILNWVRSSIIIED